MKKISTVLLINFHGMCFLTIAAKLLFHTKLQYYSIQMYNDSRSSTDSWLRQILAPI